MNPPMKYWNNEPHYDKSIIVYYLDDGIVYGGCNPERTVKEIEQDADGFYPGGDFTMELDLSNRSFVMEISGEKIILDANLGDFQFSPIVIMDKNAPKITLL